MTLKEIKILVQKLAGTYNKELVTLYLCTVDSVNESERTCNVTTINSQAELQIEDVLLSAQQNDGYIEIPKVGSEVLIVYSKTNGVYVVKTSDLEKLKVTINKTTFVIEDGATTFNGGKNGGLAIVEKLVEKYNNLENAFNQHLVKYNAHIHAGVTVGAGVTAIPSTLDTNVLVKTVKKEIEDTKVIH